MVSFTGTAGAAAPHRAAASSAAVMTAALTKGRAASCTATSSPCAASTPFFALSARVAPPATICTGFGQSAACCATKSRFLPATSTSSVTCGHWAKARMLRCSTVSPPRSKLSLSKPMRVEEPAATNTADTVFSISSTYPAAVPRCAPTAAYNKPCFIIAYHSANFNRFYTAKVHLCCIKPCGLSQKDSYPERALSLSPFGLNSLSQNLTVLTAPSRREPLA